MRRPERGAAQGFWRQLASRRWDRPLGLERLEDRSVPAVTATFMDFTLAVAADAGDSITITEVGGLVKVNGLDPDVGLNTPGPVPVGQIHTLSIAASGVFDNQIDLLAVVPDTFTGLQTITIDGGGEGGTGDTLIGPDQAKVWDISTANQGSLYGGGISQYLTFTFQSVENLTGASENDTFIFANGVGVSGVIDAGGGLSNTLDYSAYTAANPVSIDLAAGTATGTGGIAGTFHTLSGGAGQDTLAGPDTNNTWYITTQDSGQLSTPTDLITFTSFQSLVGGSQDDTFQFSDSVGLTGTLTGGAGADTLDVAGRITNTNVNLRSTTVLGVNARSAPNILGGAANGLNGIENVTTGFGDDILIGDGNGNTLLAGPGNDTFVAGTGTFVLDGSDGNNTYLLSPDGVTVTSYTLTEHGTGDSLLDFSSAGTGVDIDLDTTTVQALAPATSLTFTIAGTIYTFYGSPFNDNIKLQPLTFRSRFVDGNSPVLPTLPGDSLLLDNTAPPLPVPPTNQTFTYTGPGSAEYTSNEYEMVSYVSIETFSSTSPIPNLIINATATNRDFRVVRNGATVEVRDITNEPTNLFYPYPGDPYFVFGYTSFETVTIRGRAQDSNRVILDFGGSGSPYPGTAYNPITQPTTPGVPGFQFAGDAIGPGPISGIDRLDIAGGNVIAPLGSIATTYSGADSGFSDFADPTTAALGRIAFFSLEEYDLSGGNLAPEYDFSTTIQDLTFDFMALAGPTTATFENSGGANDGVSRVVTSSGPTQFVPTAFRNPDNRLNVATTAASADTVLLGDMDNSFAPTTLSFTGNSSADVYQLTDAGFLNSPAPGLLLTTATFDMNGVSDTLAWLHDLNNNTSQLALSGGATLTTGDATNHTYNGVISGSGNLIKQGAGSWTLGGTVNNSYTGSTTVNAGTLYLNKGSGAIAVGGNLIVGDGVGGNDADLVQFTAGNNQIISSSLVTVHSTGLLDLAGFSNTLAGLTLQSGSTFAATVDSGAGTLTLGSGANVTLLASGSGLTPADVNGKLALAAGGHTFSIADGSGVLDGTGAAADTDLLINAAVSGAGALTKTDPGRLQLTGGNTYSGVTTISQGVLHLTGSLTGAGGGVVLDGATTVLSGGTSGVLSGAGRGVTVTANGDNASIRDLQKIRNTTAGASGVTVQAGANVRLVNNTGPAATDGISGHAVNVDVSGASVFLQGNKINGIGTSGSVGLRIQGGAIVDAGQVGGGYDFTGLRLTQGNPALANGSTGGNVFGESVATGYTAGTATVGGAIRDLNTNGLNAAAGPQGAPFDAYAQNNSFNGLASVPANYVAIENLVRHDYDSSPLGFVNYVTPPPGGPVLIIDGDGALLFYSVTPTGAKNNSWDQRSMLRRVRMSFSDFVFIEASALALTRQAGFEATGGAVSPTTTVSRVGPVVFDPTGAGTGRYFNYDFGFGGGNVEASGSLVDGNYTLALDETKIQASISSTIFSDPSLQIDPVADQVFHRLFGDHNGDAKVTSVDQAIFTPSYRSIRSQTKFVEYFDFDNDGDIDLADQTQFNRRLNRY